MASRHTWAEVTSFSPREYAFLYDQLHIIAGHEGESSEVLKYRYGDGLLADAVIENRVMEMAELVNSVVMRMKNVGVISQRFAHCPGPASLD